MGVEEGFTEHAPLISTQQEHKLYDRRWYILFVFGLLSATQSMLWITYNAVGQTTKELYGTTWSNVNFLLATGPIGFIPLSFVTSWAIGEYGLRISCVFGALLCAAGAVLRCFASEETYGLVVVAQLLNAASGPVVMNAPPAVSAAWFGVNERTLATAIGTIANSVGSASGFLLGLWVTNTHQLTLLLYYEGIFAVGLLVLMVAYFPARPPTPPTSTSALKREDKASLWSSFISMMRESWWAMKSRDGCMILLAAGIAAGANGGWNGMLVLILSDHYNQSLCQWLGLFNIVGTVIGGLALGAIHDRYRHFKVLISTCFLLAAGVFVFFSLATERFFIVPFSVIMLLNIAAGLAVGAISPVAYEAMAEVTYPVKEENSANLLSLVNNLACLALIIVADYKTGTFMNWTMVGICGACFLMILMTRERYLRTNIDLK